MRDKPMVATKCGRRWDEKGKVFGSLTRDSVRAECEASLRRLGVDVIDLYQIHWPDPEEYIEEAWDAIAGLVKEGKVRYGGVSNFSVEQMERVRGIFPISSLQPPYSMIRRKAEKELFEYCRTNDIGVIVYSPMQKGLLTGKYTRELIAAFPEDDHRRNDSQFKEPTLSANLELVEGLRRIADRHGRTCAQLALAWVLRRKEVTAAITGMRRASQAEDTTAAGEWELDEGVIREIEELLRRREERLREK